MMMGAHRRMATIDCMKKNGFKPINPTFHEVLYPSKGITIKFTSGPMKKYATW